MPEEPSKNDQLSSDDEETTAPPPGPIGQESLGQFLEGLPRCEPGRYETGGVIGQGGMGTVHEVHDATLDRTLAMKAIRNRFDPGQGSIAPSPHELWRFLAEARITARLDHPGIVPVHELGVSPAGQVYFTMKRVEGDDLLRILHRLHRGHADWPLSHVLELLVRVGDTLAFAHDRGVVHRDLKPSNIMVGAFGEVYVMDWGLAKVVSGDLVDADGVHSDEDASLGWGAEALEAQAYAGLTLHGTVVGSPPYMPPEQAAGDLERIGAHTDVYALGALLYHALAGAPPYVETTSTEQAGTDILAAVKARAPQPLSILAPDAPAELVAICEKAMARDPADRYASAASFAQDLRNFSNDRVVEAYGANPILELRKWIRRNRALATSVAIGVLVVIGVVGAFGVRERLRGGELRAALGREQKAHAGEVAARLRMREAHDGERSARERAVGLRLAAVAESMKGEESTLALLLAMEAMKRAPGSAARQAVLGALSMCREQRVLTGHDGYVQWGAWIDGGRLIVSRDVEGILLVWDPDSGELVSRIFTPGDPLVAAHGQAGSEQLVTLSRAGSLQLWDARSGTLVRQTAVSPGGREGLVAMSPRLDLVCSTDADGACELLETLGLARRVRLPGGGAPAAWIRFSESGDRFVVVDGKGLTRVLDTATGDVTRQLELPLRDVEVRWLESLCSDRSCLYIATGDDGRFAAVYSLEDGEVVFRDDEASGVFLSPAGDVLAVSTLHGQDTAAERTELAYYDFPQMELRSRTLLDGTCSAQAISEDSELQVLVQGARKDMSLVSTRTSRIEGRLLGHRYHITHMAFSPRGKRMLSTANDQTVRIWWARPPDREQLRALGGEPGSGKVLALVPDARFYVRARVPADGAEQKGGAQFDVIDRAGGYVRKTVADRKPSSRVELSHDGARLAYYRHPASGAAHWRILGLRDGSVVDLAPGFSSAGRFSRDGSRFLSRGASKAGGVLRVNATSDGSVIRKIDPPTSFVGCAISPHGDLVATADRYELRGSVFSVETGELLLRGGDHHGMVIGVEFDPTGARVATAAADSTVQIWDAKSGKPLAAVKGLPIRQVGVSWSDDGELLVLNTPGTLFLAEAATGSIQATLDFGARKLARVEPSPDGSCVWVLDSDGLLERVPLLLLQEAEQRVARHLSPGELKEYDLADDETVLAASRRQALDSVSFTRLYEWAVKCKREGRRDEARASFQRAVELWEGLPKTMLVQLYLQLMDVEDHPGDEGMEAAIHETIASLRRTYTSTDMRQNRLSVSILEEPSFAPYADSLMK